MTIKPCLYKTGLLRLTQKKIKKWERQKETAKLIFAFETGMYDIRMSAAEALGNLNTEKVIPTLRKGLQDEVMGVFIAVAQALKRISKDPEIWQEIAERSARWQEREDQRRENFWKQSPSHGEKWDKRDWIGILKEQMKKPMGR